eukprot:5613417-Prymnesium_polylepis.1
MKRRVKAVSISSNFPFQPVSRALRCNPTHQHDATGNRRAHDSGRRATADPRPHWLPCAFSASQACWQMLHQQLQSIISEQLAPFKQGIDDALLERAWTSVRLRRAHKSDDFMRIRVIGRSLYMNKRGRCLHNRHKAYLEGLLKLLETHDVPNVDFIMSTNDNPACEAEDEPLPIGTFSKSAGCSNILIPCWSMMQDMCASHSTSPEVADRTFVIALWHALKSQIARTLAPLNVLYTTGSGIYSYEGLTRQRGSTDAGSTRSPGLWWDALGAGSSTREKALRALMNHTLLDRIPLLGPGNLAKLQADERTRGRFRQTPAPLGTVCPNATHWVHMEGVTYSMRLKNILLCGNLAVWVDPPPERDRYNEYWFSLLHPLSEHMWMLDTADADGAGRSGFLLGQRARRMAAQTTAIATEALAPTSIMLYLQLLLTAYSELHRGAPLDVDASTAAGFVRVTKKSLHRFCACESQGCFDKFLHFVAACRAPSSAGSRDLSGDLLVVPAPEINCMSPI